MRAIPMHTTLREVADDLVASQHLLQDRYAQDWRLRIAVSLRTEPMNVHQVAFAALAHRETTDAETLRWFGEQWLVHLGGKAANDSYFPRAD